MTDAESPAESPAIPDAMPPLPAIPASAGALIYDGAGRLLILKPTYKAGWTIPGGVMEADGETPWDACRREVREECGLEVRGGRLACVDFRPSRPERAGGIRFLFDCGAAGDAELASVTVQPAEVAEFRLVALDEALELLRPPIRRRVRAATRHRRCVYLEDGRPVDGVRLALHRPGTGFRLRGEPSHPGGGHPGRWRTIVVVIRDGSGRSWRTRASY